MYFVWRDRVWEKDRIGALLAFLSGLVFLFGDIIFIGCNFSWPLFFAQIFKITKQSNFMALVISGLYFFRPNHRIFFTNLHASVVGSILCLAGLGFWIILFPVYCVDLGEYFIDPNERIWMFFSCFYLIWNHTFTQFFYLIFFFLYIKKNCRGNMVMAPLRQILFWAYLYLISWLIFNICINFSTGLFPTYGIFTNFNPYWGLEDKSKITKMFNIRYLLFSNLGSMLIVALCSFYFFFLSHKLRIVAGGGRREPSLRI